MRSYSRRIILSVYLMFPFLLALLLIVTCKAYADEPVYQLKSSEQFMQRDASMEALKTSVKVTESRRKEFNTIKEMTGLDDKAVEEIIVSCNRWDIPKPILLAVFEKESEFKPDAKNGSSSATGLGQLLHSTARNVCSRSGEHYDPKRLTEPEYNIRLTSYYLSQDLYRWRKSWPKSLSDYKGGDSDYAKDVLKRAKKYSDALGESI